MKNIIFTTFLLLIVIIINSRSFSQSSWVQQRSGTNAILWSMDFLDENSGYICGSYGTVLKTTNSGDNWTSLSTGNYELIGIDFINEMTGWVSGHYGTIYKTTNGGLNWINQISPTFANLFFVQFLNEDLGFISSDAGVLRTSNGGANWDYSFYSINPVYSVYFLNEEVGFFGDNLGNQYRSNDGGLSWNLIQNVPGTGNISYYFNNSEKGWSVGYNNKMIKTSNGGLNWESISNGLNPIIQLRDIEFINSTSDIGFVVGNYGVVIKTSNGGNNWLPVSVPVEESFNAVKFVNPITGWIIGTNGTILKTINGGLTGTELTGNSIPAGYELSQNYPNPFNPTTNLEFGISEFEFVSLKVYDLLGKEVASLVNEKLNPGKYKIRYDASNLNSGVYYYKLSTDNFVSTKKMTLIK